MVMIYGIVLNYDNGIKKVRKNGWKRRPILQMAKWLTAL